MPKKGEFKSNATERSKYQRKYNSKPAQKKRRAERNASRTLLKKAGVNVNGKDVDHKNKNTADKSRKNLRVRSVKCNRADNKKRTKK